MSVFVGAKHCFALFVEWYNRRVYQRNNVVIYSVPPTLRDQPMQRVMIVGSGGSGKSTLARQLGAILSIEVVHLDRHFWQPGWVEPPQDQWRKVQAELVQRSQWIMDGNYGATQDIRLAVADTIIFLDMPRWLCLWRVLKRRIQYHGRSRPDMAPGCVEALDWKFVKWVWNYPSRRLQILHNLEQYRGQGRVVVLQDRAQVRKFLTIMQREKATISQTVDHH